MAHSLRSLSWFDLCGYRQICVARGTVSWVSKDNDEAGELQLWYLERDNFYDYCLRASKAAGHDMEVCKVIDKIKTLLTKKSKFHFV